jgi:hypothetical protein
MMTIRASSALHRPVNSYSVARERCPIDEQCKTSFFPARLGRVSYFNASAVPRTSHASFSFPWR